MAYQQMARVYDQLMTNAPYDQWVELTKIIFKEIGNVKHVADLGCGTGQITKKLAKAGFSLTGVDYSQNMLSIAQQRAMEENVSIQWIHQDLRALEGLADMDAVVSYCDVINYITEEKELISVFKRAADILKPGGTFIFDVHSLYHVQNNFIEKTFTEVDNDISYIWYCLPGEAMGEMYHDITFFVADGNDYYERFDETHHQRTYSIEFYEQLLTKAGFELRKLLGDFSLNNGGVHEKTERIFFVAEKKSGN